MNDVLSNKYEGSNLPGFQNTKQKATKHKAHWSFPFIPKYRRWLHVAATLLRKPTPCEPWVRVTTDRTGGKVGTKDVAQIHN